MNFETAAGPAITLLLVGQTTLAPMLARMPQWEERLSVKCLIRAFSVEETMSYVQHRLAVAGSDRTIFEPAAIEALHEMSHGIPRQINRLCDLALLVGFAEELRSIGPGKSRPSARTWSRSRPASHGSQAVSRQQQSVARSAILGESCTGHRTRRANRYCGSHLGPLFSRAILVIVNTSVFPASERFSQR